MIMVGRDQIVAEARRWLGTPWHHQAMLRGVGCDCIGLIAGVADTLGLAEAKAWRSDLRFRGYGRLPNAVRLLEACDIYFDRPQRVALPGDVLLMTFLKEPMHFAFMSNAVPRRMIHAYEPLGQVTEHVIDGKWQKRILATFALRGVA